MDKEIKEHFLRIEKRLENTVTKDDAKNFATKDDLRGFVTKDDAKKFATKDDLKRFATKDDLKNFATKDELKVVKDELDLFKKETKINFDITWDKMTTEFNKVHILLEHIMKELELIREDRKFAIAKDREQDKRLDKLEVKVGLA